MKEGFETITFWPYTILTICATENEPEKYGIMRFNQVSKDWDILKNMFINIQDAQEFIKELNLEAGKVTMTLPR